MFSSQCSIVIREDRSSLCGSLLRMRIENSELGIGQISHRGLISCRSKASLPHTSRGVESFHPAHIVPLHDRSNRLFARAQKV